MTVSHRLGSVGRRPPGATRSRPQTPIGRVLSLAPATVEPSPAGHGGLRGPVEYRPGPGVGARVGAGAGLGVGVEPDPQTDPSESLFTQVTGPASGTDCAATEPLRRGFSGGGNDRRAAYG